jgi:hypothetical protein
MLKLNTETIYQAVQQAFIQLYQQDNLEKVKFQVGKLMHQLMQVNLQLKL